MKKVLPLLLIVLLAFAGCNRSTATYQAANDPKEVAANAEKFVSQIEEKASKYNAEDWQKAADQFVAMCKDIKAKEKDMSQEDKERCKDARLKFVKVLGENGQNDLVAKCKEAFNQMNENKE